MTRLAFCAVLMSLVATEVQACGSQAEPCKVGLGDYHAAVPTMAPKPGERRSAVLFFHGAGGRGDAVLPRSPFCGPLSMRAISCSARMD